MGFCKSKLYKRSFKRIKFHTNGNITNVQDNELHLQKKQDANDFALTKAKKIQSKITQEGVSFDSFNGLEGVELHKSLNLKP